MSMSALMRWKNRDRWILRWVKWTFRPLHARRTIRIWRAVDTSGVRVVPSRWERASRALRSAVRPVPPDGPVWGVSMVKNEADIIEDTVRNLFSQGVEQLIVADNGSTDGTLELLQRLAAELPVHVVIDPIVPRWQGEKMTHLARAAVRNGASWIIPFDADELWRGTGGRTVAEVLHMTTANISVASWWDFFPVPVGDDDEAPYAERFPYRERDPRPQVKVAFRGNWPARIWMGNHHVTPLRRPTTDTGLRVAHFQFRTPAQMIRKANDGARSSRLAGESPSDLPQWFELEGHDEEQAAAKLRNLVNSRSLVFDPSTNW
jgi:glycosyltransferase involved in cell wall biosynthesis